MIRFTKLVRSQKDILSQYFDECDGRKLKIFAGPLSLVSEVCLSYREQTILYEYLAMYSFQFVGIRL